jgi:hypothetical protein
MFELGEAEEKTLMPLVVNWQTKTNDKNLFELFKPN